MTWALLLYTGAMQGLLAGASSILSGYVWAQRKASDAWPWFALLAVVVLSAGLGAWVLWWVARVAISIGIRWSWLVGLYRTLDDAGQAILSAVGDA